MDIMIVRCKLCDEKIAEIKKEYITERDANKLIFMCDCGSNQMKFFLNGELTGWDGFQPPMG